MNTPERGRHSVGPEPTIMSMQRLAERILDGEILLPKYQRPFCWSAPQVLRLLDSVMRNYPIGSILLWRTTEQLASENTVAGLDIPRPRPGQVVQYILDGHQRLASIVGALYSGHGIWDISYDLNEQRFFHPGAESSGGSGVMPLRALADRREMFRRVKSLPEDLYDRASELSAQLSTYQVPVVTLDGVAAEDTARIFERINSSGTAMSIVELARAGTWSEDFDLEEEMEKLLRVLDAKGFGQVDRKVLLRTITAAAELGFDIKDLLPLQELSNQQIRDAVWQASKASERAADFLSTQIRMPGGAALPYPNQFAVLVEIFRQVPKPDSSQYEAIRRWFWRTLGGEYFKGWSAAQIVADTGAISAFATAGVAEIETAAPTPRSTLWSNSRFSRNSAVSKLLGLILSYEDPLDLNTGQRIDVGKALSWQNDKEYHHFFPRAFVKREGLGDPDVCSNFIMLTSLSNIWISDRAPSDYLKDLRELESEEALRKRLRSCLIEEDAYQAALRDDFHAFQRARSETLHQRLTELIEATKLPASGSVVEEVE